MIVWTKGWNCKVKEGKSHDEARRLSIKYADLHRFSMSLSDLFSARISKTDRQTDSRLSLLWPRRHLARRRHRLAGLKFIVAKSAQLRARGDNNKENLDQK